MDLWSLLLRRGLHVSTLDYAMLGRWVGHFSRGQFFHERMASADPVPRERLLGWLVHYSIGIWFASGLLAISGLDWIQSPTVWPPLLVGIATILAPWFVMQPAMGGGVAGSRSPNPTATRLRNVGTHAIYGVGLYLSALCISTLWLGR